VGDDESGNVTFTSEDGVVPRKASPKVIPQIPLPGESPEHVSLLVEWLTRAEGQAPSDEFLTVEDSSLPPKIFSLCFNWSTSTISQASPRTLMYGTLHISLTRSTTEVGSRADIELKQTIPSGNTQHNSICSNWSWSVGMLRNQRFLSSSLKREASNSFSERGCRRQRLEG
jgi:hypothetical protein